MRHSIRSRAEVEMVVVRLLCVSECGSETEGTDKDRVRSKTRKRDVVRAKLKGNRERQRERHSSRGNVLVCGGELSQWEHGAGGNTNTSTGNWSWSTAVVDVVNIFIHRISQVTFV